MVDQIGRLVGVFVGFGLVCSGCSGTSTTTPGGSSGFAGAGASGVGGSSGVSGGFEHSGGASGSSGAPTVCPANQGVCDGSVATRCKADGSGPRAGGVDCAASKQHCLNGECSDAECVAGTKSCVENDVYVCEPDGSSLSVSKRCTAREVCDADSGYCLPRVCEPGAASCEGTRPMTCNALGSARIPGVTDCAADGKVCLAGSCEKKVCTPSTTFCQGYELHQCDPTGAKSTVSKTCQAGTEHCQVTPAGLYAFCESNACVAGTKVCAGDVIKTCNADGSLPPSGIACGKDEFCENAECKPRLCDLGTLFCQGKSIYHCQPTGPVLYNECAPDEVCQAIDASVQYELYPDLVRCAPRPCPPGTAGCALNKLGACAADGLSVEVTTDCGLSGKICATDATCVASVTETIGRDQTAQALAGSVFVGDLIEVRSPRKLTELQLWLVFPSSRELRWTVYEQVGSELVARAEVTTSKQNSAGFVGSGPNSFSYTLEAGKRYALGAHLSDDCVGVTDSDPFAAKPSFGIVLGSINMYVDSTSFSLAPSLWPDTVSQMKVTTESP